MVFQCSVDDSQFSFLRLLSWGDMENTNFYIVFLNLFSQTSVTCLEHFRLTEELGTCANKGA